jgi:chemotaxis-related protein WspB
MLLLTFGIAGNRYAVDVSRVVEVVPRIPVRPVPHAPASVVGLFNHGGRIVPVLDLGLLLGGGTCQVKLSTRIILVRYPAPGTSHALLGLVAEDVTELRLVRDDQVAIQAVGPTQAPYLGPVIQVGTDLVQILVIDRLLPEALRDMLFGGMVGLPA